MASTAEEDIQQLPGEVRAAKKRLEGCGWVFRRRPDGLWYLGTERHQYLAAMTLWEQVARAARWQAEREGLR
jgi:hypothetical protein